jgi:hypothetical protein
LTGDRHRRILLTQGVQIRIKLAELKEKTMTQLTEELIDKQKLPQED